jgi:hypothetical protein
MLIRLNNKIRSSLFLLVLLNLNIAYSYSEESESEPEPTVEQDIAPVITWSVDLERLSKNNSGNEFFWMDINNEKILVIKYFAKGRKKRGNIIMMHAQGENPDHPRITQPLATQLSQLGWQVFVPTLPIEDYPVTPDIIAPAAEPDNSTQSNDAEQNATQTNTSETATTESDVPTKKASFFADTSSYQEFINQCLLKLIEQVTPKSENLVLIGNKNSAYWILSSTKIQSDLRQVVLLDPELPKMVENDLTTSFQGQFLPIHSFMQNDTKFNAFSQAFEKQLWLSSFKRINQGLVTNRKIEIEDIRIAKAITGWVDSLKK